MTLLDLSRLTYLGGTGEAFYWKRSRDSIDL